MNSFNDWLLVSDIDGTLNNKLRRLPKNNKEVILRFVENGGNFTLCTGRNLTSMTPHYKKLGLKSPAIFMNGAGIYDFSKEKLLYFNALSSEAENAVKEAATLLPKAEASVFTYDNIYSVGRQVSSFTVAKLDNLKRTVVSDFTGVPSGGWGKVNFFGLPKTVKKIKAFFDTKDFCTVFYTSGCTLEVVANGVNKGAAVLKLAELYGIDKQNTAAVGDYFNDEAMLKAVGHPVCCGQAPKELKAISEYVTCNCNEGAVADFINYIVKKYIISEGI